MERVQSNDPAASFSEVLRRPLLPCKRLQLDRMDVHRTLLQLDWMDVHLTLLQLDVTLSAVIAPLIMVVFNNLHVTWAGYGYHWLRLGLKSLAPWLCTLSVFCLQCALHARLIAA